MPLPVVSIPHRQAKNILDETPVAAGASQFQFLIGRLKTPIESVMPAYPYCVSIPHRQAKNIGLARQAQLPSACFNSS